MSRAEQSLRRALITGIGIISPVGQDRRTFGNAVIEGRSGIAPITAFDPSPFRTPFGGQLRGFDPGAHLSEEEIERFADPYLQLALAGARQALAESGLNWSRENPPDERVGLVVGTCNGGLKTAEDQYRILQGEMSSTFNRKMNLLIRYHAVGKALSYSLGVTGPTWVVTTACSSSTTALAVTWELIAHGIVDTVLVGGVDALCLAAVAGFDALKATSTERTAPFSSPAGLNLGEGAAFWVVESSTAAQSRAASVEGELLSYALTCDAHHPTSPDPRGDGAYRTMKQAMARSGSTIDELGCVNTHGTGTEANDRAESKAIGKLIGDRPIPAYSFKSQVGHCMGAAGLIEASAGLIAMQQGIVPATINFSEPRPGCKLDYVPNTPREKEYSRFVSCNYAFGGNNAGAVIGLHDPGRPPAAQPDPLRRTVLTGSGAITSLGLGTPTLLSALNDNRCGLIEAGERMVYNTRAARAGLVPPFNARDIDRRLDFQQMNLLSRFATAAARLTLGEAGLRVGPKEGLHTGLITGVYVGPSEEDHMKATISTDGAGADIPCFTQIVANATSGWVANALLLKGYSCTVSQGADAGLYSLLLAHLSISSGASSRVLAGAADELYSRYYKNYDELNLLYHGAAERTYTLDPDTADRRVLGEGAAYVLAEEQTGARARGAQTIAEIQGYGMTTDVDRFYGPNLEPAGLVRAIRQALERARWTPEQVGLVLWSPQGNAGDFKTLAALRRGLGSHGERVPLATTVFHTGLCEASSGTITLAAVLRAWSTGTPLWAQASGLREIDQRPLPRGPVNTLVLATSELGFNLALAIAPGGDDQ